MITHSCTPVKTAITLLISGLIFTGCSSSSGDPSNDGQPNSTVVTQVPSSDGSVDVSNGTETDGSLPGATGSGDNSNQNVETPIGNTTETEQAPITAAPIVPSTTLVNFDITVPVYVSSSLQVRVLWGEKDLAARWVTDESWAISDDFPVNAENPLVITFSDGNGDITLGKVEALFKTGSSASEVYSVSADQFDSHKWDDDGDGISNLAESIAGTDPLVEDILEPVFSSLELVADKTFRISWGLTKGADFYRVLENSDGVSGFTQISEDLDSSTNVFNHRVALYKRVNARYIVQACNVVGCVDSAELNVSGSLREGVGYFKASNSDTDDNFGESVVLNADGTVLAVGTYLEDSSATSINGNQNDNSALDTGAVYMFARVDDVWQQQAYIKASNPDDKDFYGYAISLSADGKTLAVGAAHEDSAATGINGNQSDNSLNDSGAVYVYIYTDGNWQQQAYIKASNSDENDSFGLGVALNADGNTLVVSAPDEDGAAVGVNGNEGSNTAPEAGAVYVFVRVNGNWQQQAYLKASNAESRDNYGSSLGLSADGNTLAVGANRESSAATGVLGNQNNNNADASGAVYVFERTTGSWQQTSYLKASNTDSRDIFGVELSLSADAQTLAVAAYGEANSATGIDGNQNDDSFPNAGAVYVFVQSNDGWQQQAYVKSGNVETNDFFGISVSLSGDGNTMVVGAFFEDGASLGIGGNPFDNASSDTGAAYVFERNNGNWQQTAYVKPSNASSSIWFGYVSSLSADGETLAIGARYENNNAAGINGNQNAGSLRGSGAVYLY